MLRNKPMAAQQNHLRTIKIQIPKSTQTNQIKILGKGAEGVGSHSLLFLMKHPDNSFTARSTTTKEQIKIIYPQTRRYLCI